MALVSKKNLLEEYEEEQKKSAAKQKTTSAVNKTNKAAQEAAARKEADLIGAKDAGKISSKKSTLPSQRSTKQGASDFVANAYKTAQKSEYKTEKKDKTVTTAEINKKQQEAKKAVQEKKSVVGNLINAGSLDQKVKTDNNITLQNREDFKAKQQAEAAEKAKAIIQNIIDNAKNDAVIKQTVTPENREKVREQKREEVWETKEDDGAAALALKGLGNRFRTVPGTLIESGAEAFYDMTGDTVKGYSEGDKITLENRDAAKTAKIADNSAWLLNPARKKAKEISETRQAGGIYDMATEQLDSLRAMTDNELVQDLITAADGGATMLGYMALPFGTKYLSAYMAAGQVLDTYNSRREMGESKEEAAVRGITDGAIAAAVESLGGVGKIPGLNKAADVIEAAAGKNFLTNLVMQALSEGGEGFAEYALGYVGNVMNDLVFKGEIQTEFDINEAIESAWIEGLAGGMFGAGSFGIRKISGDPNTDATIGEVSSDIVAAVKSVFDMENKINKTEMPVPFDGNAVTEEQSLVAEKIAEIENSSLNEIEKAEKMEEIAKAVAETTGSADVVAEAEKFRTIHEEKAKNEYTKEYGISEDDLGEYLSAGGRTNKNKLQALKDGKDIILTTKKQVSDYIKKAISGAKDIVTVAYGKVTNRLAKDVLNYSGGRINVEGNYLELVPYDIKHAYEQHLNAKEAGNINLTIEDFEKIPEYLNNYDDIVYAIKFGSGNTRVCVSKKLPNGRVLLIETVSKSRGSMQFKNMIGITEERYIKDYEEVYKKRNISNSREGESPTIPLRDDYASHIIIPPVSGISNTSSIGNTVFSPEIFRKQEDAFEEGRAESISAEISDSAKRVAAMVAENESGKAKEKQSTTSQVNPEEESTNLVDVPQSKKSERIEKRFRRRVENGVASVFGVQSSDLKGDIRPIIEEITADLKDGKQITNEQIDRVYKQAFEDGVIAEEFPQYQNTRKYIRSTPIYVDKTTQDEFGDTYAFRDFARSNFGSMKISSDPRSSHLDSVYKTLSEIEPDYFNAEETDPKTQLEDIADFMQQTKKQYYGLSEVYSGENLADFEKWAKKELKAYMEEFGKGIDTVRMYERDRQIKATNKAREIDRDVSFDQAKAAFEGNKIFEAQKAVERAKANALLSDTDLAVVKRLHEGTMTEADVIFQNAGNVEGIIEVYNAEKAYKQARAPFDRYKAAYKTSLEVDAIANTAFSDEWKDKNIGLEYSRETAERNIKDITKNGRFGGKEIIKEYIEPVHEHEAMKNRWLSEMNRRAKEIGFGRMNKYERAYTQMIGENYKYITKGEITKHDQAEHDALNERIEDLLHKHGNKIDKAKCEKAAAGFMDIYKDIFEQWNDERIRRGQEPVGEIEGYFPHFTEAKPENLLQKIFAVLGFDVGSSKLPTDIAGRTADRKPQSKYNPFANRRTTDVTDYDVLKGFDSYVRAVADNIYHTEDIQKLRALSDTIRTKYSSAETEKRIEDIRNRKDLPEEEKEILIADVFKAAPGAYHLSNFVVWLDEYTNILAGKKSRGDREAEYEMGREVYDVAKALEGRIASNMIGYNISTPIMNLVPLFQAAADISPSDIISSVIQTGISAAQKNSFISENSDFITNRFGVDTLYNQNYNLFSVENTKDFVSKVSDGGGLLMELVDRVVSESLVRARYEQNIRKGMGKVDAFSEADQWAAELIADRSLGALPTIFNVKNPVAKALTMFQVEANNQYSYIMKDAGKYKWDNEGAYNTIIGQLAFWAAMAICNGLAKELLGRDNVVPDPIGLTAKTLEKIQKGEPTGEVVYDTATNIVEQLPFVGGLLGGGRVPLSTALPDTEQAAKLLNPEISGEKKGQILLDEILKPLSYILLPSGAGQIWKSGKGIQQIAEGGAYGMDNNGKEYMKFPQVYDVESVIKTLLFGQYASDAGQKYIDSGFSDKLSAKQTEQMKLAENFGVPKEEFYDVVLGLKGIDKKAEKQQALFDMDISERTKNVIDGILFGKTTYKTEVPAATRNYSDPEAFYESGLEKNEFALHEMGYSEKEIETITKALKESGKKAQDIENLADALDIEEAEAFEVYQKIKGEWINEAKDLDEEDFARAEGARTLYGMSTENYIAVLNYSKYGAQIKNEDGETEYSTKAEYVIPHIMEATGWNKELATEMYNRVHKYDYTRADLEEEQAKQLDTSAEWYGVEDKGYFTARNIIKMAEGEKDQYGNTVSGSKKEAAIKAIAEQMKIGTEEATIYYLAASGGLALSVDDLSTSHREDLKTAIERGWTERQYLDAVNIIKLSGADSKDEIIKALTDAGASYSMAQGYYNLRQNKDYNKAAYFAYGMKNEKQVTKADYFMEHYGKGNVTAKDVTAWYKAASGCSKKQEYIDAYKSAGATQDQAVKFYNLMRGYDKTFNAWYKENGGT